MKKYFWILLCVLQFNTIHHSKASEEFTSLLISERFQIYNALFHYKIWSVFDFLIKNKGRFGVTRNELIALSEAKEKIVAVDYLFREEEHWMEKCYRSFKFNTKQNSKQLKQFKQFLNNFTQLNTNQLKAYRDSDFTESISWDEIDWEVLKGANEIRLKEDWVYNRVKGTADIYISAFALIKKEDGLVKTIAWFPYLKLKPALGQSGLQFVKLMIEQGNADSHVLYHYMDDMSGKINMDERKFTYLDVFIKLQELEKKVASKLNDHPKVSVLKFTDDYLGQVEAMVENGKLHGAVKISYDTQVKIEIYYHEGIKVGDFNWYYPDGSLYQSGAFQNNLRDGEWLAYHENGNLSAKRVFAGGIMYGEQREFFTNGSPAVIYQFEDGFLHGDYLLINPKGIVLQKGSFYKGVMQGDWEFTLTIPNVLSAIIQRNKEYFDKYYQFEMLFKSALFMRSTLKAKASFYLIQNNECLNNLCSSIEIVSVE